MCKTNSPIMKIKACEDCKNSEALIFDVIYCFMYNEHFIVLHISNNILLEIIPQYKRSKYLLAQMSRIVNQRIHDTFKLVQRKQKDVPN